MDDSSPADSVRALARGTRALAIAQVLAQVVRFGSNIVLARLLTPSDFGVVALALVIVLVSNQFQDLGTGSAIIQQRALRPALTNAVFHLNVVLGTALSLVVLASAHPLADLMHTPESAPVLMVMSVMTFVSSLGQIHHALLRRELRFRETAIVAVVATITTAAVSIVLAAFGAGVWSIVWGSVLGSLLDTAMVWRYDHWRPSLRARWRELQGILRFCFHLFLANISSLLFQQADKVLIGRALGTAPLGVYSMAQRVVTYPTTAITTVVTEIAFPVFSRRQDDDVALRSGYVRLSGVLAVITFPLLIGAATVADPLVALLFGSAWSGLVPLIQILAPVVACQTVMTNWSGLLMAKGRTDWVFAWNAISSAAMIGAYVFGLQWGLVGMCVSYAIAAAAFMPIGLLLAFRLIGMRLRDYFVPLLPVAFITILMGVASAMTQWAVRGAGANTVLTLISGVSTGALTYVLLLAAIRPAALRDIAILMRSKRSG